MKAQQRAKAKNGANLEHAHLLNQRVVLDTVRLHGRWKLRFFNMD
jgi:hypothetical protein